MGMDDLIWRCLQGLINADEQRALEQWRAASAANERQFQQLRALWQTSEPPRPATRRPSAAQIIAVDRARVRDRWHRWRHWRRTAMAAAAAIVLLFGAHRFWPAASREAGIAPAEIVTGANELSTITLGDGTVVRLAPASRLRLPRGPNAREVWLDGRAYFAVTQDARRRFKVHTPLGDAIVLGTRFDLRTDGNHLRLLVVEGKVQLEASGRSVQVGARRLAQVAPAEEPAVAEVDDDYIQQALGWTGGFLAFESTPLRDAARELSNHYDVPITVTDSVLARQTVSGWFADEPLEDVLMILCRAVRAQCALRAAGATIAP